MAQSFAESANEMQPDEYVSAALVLLETKRNKKSRRLAYRSLVTTTATETVALLVLFWFS